MANIVGVLSLNRYISRLECHVEHSPPRRLGCPNHPERINNHAIGDLRPACPQSPHPPKICIHFRKGGPVPHFAPKSTHLQASSLPERACYLEAVSPGANETRLGDFGRRINIAPLNSLRRDYNAQITSPLLRHSYFSHTMFASSPVTPGGIGEVSTPSPIAGS